MNRVGIDILDISRVQKAIERNDRFKDRIYTGAEIQHIQKKNSYKTAGGIFAAKEAVSKCLGTGISGFSWKDIEIINDSRGKPTVALHRGAKRIAFEQGVLNIEVSISHSQDTVVAIALGTVSDRCFKDISKPILPRRQRGNHKGDYGKVALLGGSQGMSGSIYLSSLASLRSGSGLVYTLVPKTITQILEIKSLENIVIAVDDKNRGYLCTVEDSFKEKLKEMDAIGLGPGMSKNEETVEFLRAVLEDIDRPYVIDADGINNLSELKEELSGFSRKIVITPHLGELSRFIDVPIAEIADNREAYAVSTAKQYGLIVVLKGKDTIVTDGIEVYVNKNGNPGMATAGSGDVLTGIISSFIGQGYALFEAAKIGVYIHGLAGDIASYKIGEYGMIASDIVSYIPEAIKRVEFKGESENYEEISLGGDKLR